MKLRNLLFGTMIACAFASCSDGDDPIDNGGGNIENPNAKFSLKFEAPIISKSGNTTGADNAIANLNVYVFNGTTAGAKLEAVGTLTADTTNESKDIPVSAGDKSVVVVANESPTMTVGTSTLENLYAAKKDFGTTEKNGTISMNSRTYVVSVIAGVTNYLGYTTEEASNGNYLVPTTATGGDLSGAAVKLYRNVAKINLQSITVSTANSQNKYSNAKFILSDVFVLHAPKSSYVVGGPNPWNSTYDSGNSTWLGGPEGTTTTANSYSYWVKTVNDWIAKDPTNHNAKKPYLTNGYEGGLAPFQAAATLNTAITEGNTYPTGDATSIDYFYSYENLSSTHTLLVVKGKFIYGENADEANFPERYYSVSVGHDGMGIVTPPAGGLARPNDKGVLRNMQYNIDLTIQGPGWETPFGPDGGENTALDVKVEVVAFSLVNQEVVIE